MPQDETITIGGPRPGDVGEVVRLHGTYYDRNWRLDASFEAEVSRELGEFMERYDPEHDVFLVARRGEAFCGGLVLDAADRETLGVRLRWFIVPEEMQGHGIGTLLMDEAAGWCGNKGYGNVFLWTYDGLGAARKLYERYGFTVAEEIQKLRWGRELTVQRFQASPFGRK